MQIALGTVLLRQLEMRVCMYVHIQVCMHEQEWVWCLCVHTIIFIATGGDLFFVSMQVHAIVLQWLLRNSIILQNTSTP